MSVYEGGGRFGLPLGTKYAVRCFGACGLVPLTEEQYSWQMGRPDQFWVCPQCGKEADWEDEVHGDYGDWLASQIPEEPTIKALTMSEMTAYLAVHGQQAKEDRRLAEAGWEPTDQYPYCGPCGNAGGLYKHRKSGEVHCWMCLAHLSGADIDAVVHGYDPSELSPRLSTKICDAAFS